MTRVGTEVGLNMPLSLIDTDKYSKEIVRSGASLSWTNLSIVSTKNGNPQKILKNCSGISYSGEILAIMGSSGSGKTSLVTLLADQFLSTEKMIFKGKVSLNDVVLNKSTFSTYVKFVNQHDLLMPTLTAREAMVFTALLNCIGNEDHVKEYVSTIITQLKIEKFADCIIGDTMIKGLSGGEKKLVSIAHELISQPTVLILDEPTSGLDSSTATRVMKLLRQQADLGKNIILTIHQPSNRIFDMFDRLLLISQGKCIYQGSTMETYKYFANINYVCPSDINPSDYFDKICYVKNYFDLTEEESKRLELLKNSFKFLIRPKIEKEIQKNFEEAKGLDRFIMKVSPWTKVKVLTKRSFVNSRRHPLLFTLRIVQAVFISCLNALIFNNIGTGLQSVQSRNGLMFYNLDCLFLLSTQVELLALQSERNLYIKEIRQGNYGTIQYFLSKVIAEIPIQMMFVFLFCIIQYFAVPFNIANPGKFLIFFSVCLISHFCGAGLGYMVGGLANSPEEALIMGGALGIPLMMFAGFFSNIDTVNVYTRWLKYISPFYYAFEALAINEYTDLKLDDGLQDPLDELNITNTDISIRLEALIGLEILYISIALAALKIKEVYRYQKKSL